MADEGRGGGRMRGAAARIEWAAAALAALLVAGLVAALLREAATDRPAHPELIAVAEPPMALADGRSLVLFSVANHGGRAAAGVAVALDTRRGDALLDRRRVTLDYVAARSEAGGGFYLGAVPADATLSVTVEGYVDP